ncbi:PKD domain-containing protein [Actinophytocola sp. NPDC049390]|uniref:PKD domain-containing protein n=1 Tax=Actinophytocola sp. NPDC049390 TaxID=3363894 RepID=UPI00379956C4
MTNTIVRRTWTACLAAAVLAVLAPGVARAEAPSNDDFDTAATITALPFESTVDTTGATVAADDPVGCQSSYGNSVWFRYTAPEDGIVRAIVDTPGYYPFLTAYTGTRGGLARVPGVCVFGSRNPETFHVTAGTTYHFLVGANYHDGGATTFRLESEPPAANDDIADALRVPGLPTTVVGDLSRAWTEPGEPTPSCDATAPHSLWYVYSPATPRWVSVSAGREVTVYRGTPSVESEVDCTRGTPAVFHAQVGEDYYVRVAAPPEYAGPHTIDFATAPALRPTVYPAQNPANVLEHTLFNVNAGDPLGRSIVGGELTFGDGSSVPITSGGYFQHRYATDGEYRLGLSVVTDDGRTGTATATLRVETHDVTVTALAAPATARADQTKPITVSVTNDRYDETVRVELYKQSDEGAIRIGVLTLSVPAGRTVQFPFAYTFGPADVGTVTFRAVARLDPYGWTEANLGDNEMSATTTVRQ